MILAATDERAIDSGSSAAALLFAMVWAKLSSFCPCRLSTSSAFGARCAPQDDPQHKAHCVAAAPPLRVA